MKKTVGKMFTLANNREIFAEENGYNDNTDHFELRSDRAYYIRILKGKNDDGKDVSGIAAFRVDRGVTGSLKMKLYKHSILSTEDIGEDSQVYAAVVHARSNIVIPKPGEKIVAPGKG